MKEFEMEIYSKICDMVYQYSGIRFDEKKADYVFRRLDDRIEFTGAAGLKDYYQTLRFDTAEVEIRNLVEILTTNETYFFREYPQLQSFAEFVLPEVLALKSKKNDHWLNIWSAGCSTGEEPYTLAIILREMIEDFSNWKISILATDINQEVLKTAKRGIYKSRSVKDVPTEYLNKYFEYKDDSYHLSPIIKNMVSFREINLKDTPAIKGFKGQDFIFCRNVIIYFDEKVNKILLENFYDILDPGGYIFLGHSESVGRITSAFKLLHQGNMLVYQK
jgi:chemotaxis protein methyltransferase CheR